MNRIVKILGCCLALALAACSQDPVAERPEFGGRNGDGIAFTLSFPEMESVATRAFADSPTPDELDIFLFVFDGENLLQTIHIPTDYEGRTNDDGKIKFTAKLPQTANDAIVHIVAIDDSDKSFAAQIDSNGYGVEDTVIPGLSVSGDTDAYWQRVAVGCPIKVGVDNSDNDLDDVQGTDEEVQEVFNKTIHLVRNFAKVTLVSEAPNFTVLAWTIVNERDGGSVAPWYSKTGSTDIQYAEYFYTKDGKEAEADYDKLTADGYIGVSQAGAQLRNTLDEIGTNATGDNWVKVEGNTLTEKYIYERRNTSVNPLYLLIYGELRGSSGSTESSYYKLALGQTDHDTGLFTPYNVLRNIAYSVTIDAVTGKGASTPGEAAAGPASNNISGDVVTSNLTQISDGVDRLEVNFTNYVVTTAGQSVDFRFRYTQNFTSSPNVNNKVVIFENSPVGIKEGEDIVISSYSYDKDGDGIKTDDDGWSTIHIVFNDPSEVLKQQSFTLYSTPVYEDDGSLPETNTMGLSRTINFVLREPWDFIRMETYPGNWADDDKFPDWDSDTSEDDYKLVGPNKGDALTVFFELPAGLPQAIFPLECTFESDRQNIENDGKGSAVVQTGPSLFSGVLDHRISYTKTVNWQDYAPDGESSTARSRIQRARFVTTTNISSLEGNNYVSTIRLHNPYFNDKDDKFERVEGKDVETPKNSVRTIKDSRTVVETVTEFTVVWDLSDNNWDAVATQILTDNTDHPIAGTPAWKKVTTTTTTTATTQVIKTVDGEVVSDVTTTENFETNTTERTENVTYNLTIDNDNNNAARKFKVDMDGDSRYFYTNYGSNLFSLSAISIESQAYFVSSELEITAAPVDGGSVTPRFTLQGLTSLVVNNTNQPFSGSDKQTNKYSITPGTRNNNYRTITITPAGNNAYQQIKFYKFVLTEQYKKTDTDVHYHTEDIVSGE